MAAADRAGAAYLQFRQDEAFSLGTRDAAVDAVQAPVHPDLQLIGRLSTHPFSQFIDRRCPSPAIFSEDFKQRTRPLQPPSVRVTAGVIAFSIWHGVPPARDLGRIREPGATLTAQDPRPRLNRRCLNCTLMPPPTADVARKNRQYP
jgi:hypothetical protein